MFFTTPSAQLGVGESMTITNTATGDATYVWTFSDGFPTSSTDANPTVNFSTAGSKTITLTATNACGSSTYSTSICVGTSVRTMLETFETSAGRFTSAPTASGSTTGIATTSTLARATDNFKNGIASLKAVLNDNTTSNSNWVVRLLSGGGTPANNQVFTGNQGYFGFWLKTSTANTGAVITAWIDDTDGLEELPPLAIINNGNWNYYEWFLPTAAGAAITIGNGKIGGTSVTLDAIVVKQNNTANAMTVWIDDIQHTSACSGMLDLKDIDKIDDSDALVVYPNPTDAILSLKLGSNTESGIRLFNILGQQVLEDVFHGMEKQLDLSRFVQGIYLLQVKTDSKTIYKKIILRR